MNDIRKILGKRLLIGDGAMGTMLQARGLAPGALPESMNLTSPETVLDVHRAYLKAGSDYITANTFGAHTAHFAREGISCETLVTAGVSLARKAAGEAGREVFVALDVGPTGRVMSPAGDMDFEEAVGIFAPVMRAGAAAGADFVLIETMPDLYEAKAALTAARENCALPVVVTVTAGENGRLLSGAHIRTAMLLLESWGADGAGLNCGFGPEQAAGLMSSLQTSLPVFISPNAGLPAEREGHLCYDIDPEGFSRTMETLADSGASALGGCCGTTPEHIARMAELCGGRSVRPRLGDCCTETEISTGTRVLTLRRPLPPVGALPDGVSGEDAVDMAYERMDEGAALLSVPPSAVRDVQGMLPLLIRSNDPAALGAALRLHGGKALVPVTRGPREEALIGAVARYGGVLYVDEADEKDRYVLRAIALAAGLSERDIFIA